MPETMRVGSRERSPGPMWDSTVADNEFAAGSHRAAESDFVRPDFVRIASSEEFQELRSAHRCFAFPMSAVFLLWYLTYVVVAAYNPAFMGIRLCGEINVGLLMGVGQFVSTIAITALYLRFAVRRLDPLAAEVAREARLGQDGENQ